MAKAAVRIVCRDGSSVSFGSGVIVAPTAIVTARHVLQMATGDTCSPAALRLQSPFWMADMQPATIFAPAGQTDLALIRLEPPNTIEEECCAAMSPPDRLAINVGDEVEILGFSTIDRQLEPEPVRVVSADHVASAYVCNKALPRGFSGGPVFDRDVLVGIAFARHFDAGRGYFYGTHQVAKILEQAEVGGIRWERSSANQLRQFPLGPMVDPIIALARLHEVIDACGRLFPGQQALLLIARANEMRLTCGPVPDPVAKAIVETSDLPDPRYAPKDFWIGAFQQAAMKSPRMLAAMLTAIEPDRLNARERTAVDGFVSQLREWK